MVHLIGNVVRDAIVKDVNGKDVIKFTLAINKRYVKSTGEPVRSTTFIDCEYWKKSDVYLHITKGKLVEVIGSLSHRAYVNRQGEAIPVLECNVGLLELHSSKGTDQSGNQTSENYPDNEDEVEPVALVDATEDLPF